MKLSEIEWGKSSTTHPADTKTWLKKVYDNSAQQAEGMASY